MISIYKRQINESRPSKAFDLASAIGRQVDSIEKLVDINYTSNGVVALYRTKDGNAYQVEIKAAQYADKSKFGNPNLLGKKK